MHRDIKPDNIMVTAQDRRAVIMDLGLARLEDVSQSLTRADHGILGTLRYMPPEQLRGDASTIDRRADLYALGACLYEAVCGQPMLDGDSVPRLVDQVLNEQPAAPRAVNGACPADLEAIIQKATAKSAADRYATARHLASDLQAFEDGKPISARRPTLAYLLKLTIKRHRVAAAALLAAVLFVVVGGVLFVRHLDDVRATEHALRLDAERALGRSEALATSLRAEQRASDRARRRPKRT